MGRGTLTSMSPEKQLDVCFPSVFFFFLLNLIYYYCGQDIQVEVRGQLYEVCSSSTNFTWVLGVNAGHQARASAFTCWAVWLAHYMGIFFPFSPAELSPVPCGNPRLAADEFLPMETKVTDSENIVEPQAKFHPQERNKYNS